MNKLATGLLKLASDIDAQIKDILPVQRPGTTFRTGNAYDTVIIDPRIVSASKELYNDGYYAQAVEECCKSLCNEVKSKSQLNDSDGFNLMMKVFNENGPILALNKLKSLSEKDEQRGYKHIYGGVMAGIRNPRAHEHEYLDDALVALEMISLCQHLVRKLDEATRKRQRRTRRQ